MALRKIREYGDNMLRKKSKPVKNIDKNIIQLLDDMAETMASKDGVGLAAVQVGILKRIILVERIEEEERKGLIELINPEVLEVSGMQERNEGCLSIIGRSGIVERPEYVKVKGLNRNGEEIIVEGEGFLAVALCHEMDHLDGILYIDKIIEDTSDEEDDEE